MRIHNADLPRVLTTVEARRLGVSRSALRHAVAVHGWRRLTAGIYLTDPAEPTRDDWVAVGLACAGARAALSGWDAVRIHGVGARTPTSPFTLVLDRTGNHRTIGGVRIRPTARPYSSRPLPADHPTLAYVPVVTPARAVADTALMIGTFAPVRALVTSAVQRGLCRPEDLHAELAASPRAGSHWLRRSLDDVLDGARSIAEAEASDRLRAAQIPAYELNVPIMAPTGRVLAVADVLWRRLRAVLEIDSREFHFGEDDWKATMRRHNLLTACGLAVRHDPPSEIRRSGSAWAGSIRDWLRARADELGIAFEVGDGPVRSSDDGPEPLRIVRTGPGRW